jgi:hypothetical protein
MTLHYNNMNNDGQQLVWYVLKRTANAVTKGFNYRVIVLIKCCVPPADISYHAQLSFIWYKVKKNNTRQAATVSHIYSTSTGRSSLNKVSATAASDDMG